MKKIAFTQRLVENNAYLEIRDALDVRWSRYCEVLGVLPILLPTEYDFSRYFTEFEIAGIIFTGGNDLSSVNPSPLSIKRDIFEAALLDYAIRHKVPVLGICRGMQLIATHFGAQLETTPVHSGTRHTVAVNKDSRYYEFYCGHTDVNSYHTYQVTRLPECLCAVATSPDGVIEALQHLELPIEAQMWHPEREASLNKNDLLLAQQLFKL